MATPSYAGLTVATGDVITATWGEMVRDSVVLRFASAAARNSAITAPEEGMVAYLLDQDVITVYNGTAWEVSLTCGAPIDYSASFTLTASTSNPTKGNSVYVAKYGRTGRVITVTVDITIGSTFSAGSGTYRFLLPFTAANRYGVGSGYILDSGSTPRTGITVIASGTTFDHCEMYTGNQAVTHAYPQTPAAGDKYQLTFTYESAS